MALEFPANPVSGQRYTYQDSTWRWNGYAWEKDPYTDINASTGILYGGILSPTIGGTTFNISAGIGQIFGLTASIYGVVPSKTYVTWNDFSGITVENIATDKFTYVYIDSDGDLQQQITPFTDAQYRTDIVIGVICHIDNTSIILGTNAQNTAYGDSDRLTQLFDLFGPMKKEGLVVSAYDADLRLFRSSGLVLKIGVNYQNDPFEPDEIALSAASPAGCCRLYRDGSGDFVFDTNGGLFYTSVDPTKYDDGDGTLATVNNNQWTVQRLYVFPNNPNDIICYYGVQIYNSQDDAVAGIDGEVFSEATITRENAVFLGYLIVRGGAANLSLSADAKFIRSGFSRASGVGGGGGAGGVGTIALNDLTDVVINGVTANDILYYSGLTWINKPFNDIPIDGGIY
jgi:hypothetical protein